jgi:hypothetical protein
LKKSNHDFGIEKSWGKNIFTNAFPVAVAQYQSIELGLDPILIRAVSGDADDINIVQCPTSWREILQAEPSAAEFLFETRFQPYGEYTSDRGFNPSDVVVADETGAHKRAFEIKLTAVPDSATYAKPKAEQSSEIVARPLMIEQLAVSIAHSFGTARRVDLRELIKNHLRSPQQAKFHEDSWMRTNMRAVLEVIRDLIMAGVDLQTPMVLNVVWRTIDRTAYLEDDCFETFVWTDMAFTALFLQSASKSLLSRRNEITRPQRALIWLLKMLWDYQSQGEVDAIDATALSYGLQTDKAGSFTGRDTLSFYGPYLTNPRVSSSALVEIINPEYRKWLAPERRLDAALVIEAQLQVIESLVKKIESLGRG